MLVAVGSFMAFNLPAAPLDKPTAGDRQVTMWVARTMESDHLSKHKFDDEMSQRGLETYLKSLDPLKIYFYQSDVDEFREKRDSYDDAIRVGELSAAYTIFNRFLTRVDERIATIDELLAIEHDLTNDEEMVTDRDALRYPKDAAEARERWRKRIEYDLLVLKSDKKEGKEAIEKLEKRYHSFGKRMHQFDGEEVLEMYISAFTTAFDPHTSYMSPTSLENFHIQMKLELKGIGAALRSLDGQTIITKIIPGGAADKHGKLQPEDRVVSVGQGDDGEMVDIVDMKLNDVVGMIRGEAGTTVKLGIIPENGSETKVYKIVRARIELKDSEARQVIFEDGKKANGEAYKVGVIDLPSFYMDMEGARTGLADYKSTTRDVRKIIKEFREKNVDVVVLDLRRNGGGSLNEAIGLTGLFIDHGPVVQVKDSAGRIQHYDDHDRGMAWEGPLVVLASKFSASASEIFAGAIQDYNRGIVVGDEATHGKGTVQSLLELGPQLFRTPRSPNLGGLKITMQQFYLPAGDSTQKRGVLSDVVLPSVTTHMDVGEGDLDFAIDFDRVPTSDFKKVDMRNDAIVTELKNESAARREKSEDWQKQLRNIKRYREQKDRKTLTLNEEKFFAQRKEFDADKVEEEKFEEDNDPDEIVKRDFYFDEVIDIAIDYTEALKRNKVASN